jgi:hypothetical protein
MWVLTDVAGENVYTNDGYWLPWGDRKDEQVACFDTWEEAERVQFVLRWANQCYTQAKEVE